MGLDIKGMFGLGSDADGDDMEPTMNTSLGEGGSNKMMLLEPRAFSESQQIADYLKKQTAVVVNMKRVTPELARRIVDFLSGTLYAIGGDMQKLGGGIFLCTPSSVKVEGKISESEKDKPAKAEKDKEKDEDEFNW